VLLLLSLLAALVIVFSVLACAVCDRPRSPSHGLADRAQGRERRRRPLQAIAATVPSLRIRGRVCRGPSLRGFSDRLRTQGSLCYSGYTSLWRAAQRRPRDCARWLHLTAPPRVRTIGSGNRLFLNLGAPSGAALWRLAATSTGGVNNTFFGMRRTGTSLCLSVTADG
jgi:hypothetical protein